jgi:AcrR family transcriptional regulator
MPPKVKITNEEIIEAALTIVRKGGIASVNVREIAKILGCSIQPVFRNFKSMENLKKELYIRAGEIHNEYMEKGLSLHQIPFLGMGIAYIDFARKEKNLFRFLFMSDEIKGKGFLDMIKEEENQEIVALIAHMTGLKKERAEELFMDIWLMVQGIASLVATNDFEVSDEQIEKILKDSFLGFKYQLSI